MSEALIMAKLEHLQRTVDALLAAQRDPSERFCEAVLASWGPVPFLAADLLEWTDLAPELRRDVREAAQALCRTAFRPTPRQLGIALGRLAGLPLMWHRVVRRDDDKRKQATEWTVMRAD